MLNYIRAEVYKLARRKYTWIFLGVMLLLESLLVAAWTYTNFMGNHVDFYTGAIIVLSLLPMGFYAALLTSDIVFSEQYKHNTLKNEVSFGVPRGRIYLGKLLVQLGLSVVMCAVMIGYYLLLCARSPTRLRAPRCPWAPREARCPPTRCSRWTPRSRDTTRPCWAA